MGTRVVDCTSFFNKLSFSALPTGSPTSSLVRPGTPSWGGRVRAEAIMAVPPGPSCRAPPRAADRPPRPRPPGIRLDPANCAGVPHSHGGGPGAIPAGSGQPRGGSLAAAAAASSVAGPHSWSGVCGPLTMILRCSSTCFPFSSKSLRWTTRARQSCSSASGVM